MSTLSRLMYGLRSIQPPDEQKAPVLSVSNESATSGGLPPRMAATILLLSTAPTLFIFTAGWSLWKPFSTEFQTPSSRSLKPLHTVSVTGLLRSAVAVVFEPPPPPPPQAATPTAAARTAATTAALRRMPNRLSRWPKPSSLWQVG